MNPRPRLALGLVLLPALALGLPSTARAWGRQGHRVAAKVAEARLTPAARAAVKSLLEPGESLADASTWADEYRNEHRETGPWHYVNVAITESGYDPKFCPPEGCVVSKIPDFRKTLEDPKASRDDKQKALRFLVHCLQDMHQPVHVGDRKDRGGNDLQLQFFDEGTNLHRIWDYGVMEHYQDDEAAWFRDVDALATPENAADWAKGTVVDWANESFAAAKKAYLVPGTDRELKPGTKLGQEYQDAALPIIRRRLAQAGTRLASVLNDIFK